MGGPTSFRLTSQLPNPNEVRQMFPDAQAGSFFMQYPVTTSRYSGPADFTESDQQEFQPGIPMEFVDIDMSGWGDVEFGDADVLQFPGPEMQSINFQSSGMGYPSAVLQPLDSQHHDAPHPLPNDGSLFDVPMPDFGNSNGHVSPPDMTITHEAVNRQQHTVVYQPSAEFQDDAWLNKFTNIGTDINTNTDPYMGYHVPPAQPASPIMARGS